jgi:hypothetical protein
MPLSSSGGRRPRCRRRRGGSVASRLHPANRLSRTGVRREVERGR